MTTTLIDDTFNVGTRDGASANAYEIHFLVEVARQDVAANKSYLNITKTYKGINRWAWNQTAGTDTISGAVSSSVTITQVYPTATVITVQSLTDVPVSHNSDGTLNTTINTAWSYGSVYNQYMAKEYSKSYNVDLPPIPRASVLSLNKTSVNLNTSSGNAISYTITPYSSSFTHKIIWALGSGGNTINNAANGSLTYSQLLGALSNSANGTLSITLQTYSGSTLVGSNSASVPVSVDLTVFKPTLNVENIVVNSTPVTAATIKNYLIAGITTAKFYSTATKPTGAASVTTTFTASHGTLSASSTTSTTRQEITTNTLPSNETDGYTLTITVKATDSRGASVTVTKTATVYAYKKPKVTLEAYRVADSTSTNRDDGGSWVYVTFTSTLGATVNGQNSIQSTTCTYTGSISGTATNGAHIALTDSQNATFTVVATDKVSSSNQSVIVPTATYPLDLYYDEGTNGIEVGVGLGGLAKPNLIKAYFPINTSFNDAVAMGSLLGTSNTIPNLVNELRYSNGCMGSASITTAYTYDNVTIPTGWYNFIYSPHRSGGINGQANQDNCNYGNLILMDMTMTAGVFRIRLNNGAINQVTRLEEGSYYGTCSTAAATVKKDVSIVGFPTTLKTGLKVTVRFANANGVANPTLSINSGTAVAIKRYGTTAPSTSAASSWNAGSTVSLTYDGTYWVIDNWNNTTYSAISQANIQNTSGTSSGLITGQRFKQGYDANHTITELYRSDTGLSGTQSATWTYSADYRFYIVVGATGSGGANSLISQVIPSAFMTTSTTAKSWQFADDTLYVSYRVYYSGTTGTIKRIGGTGNIFGLYGVK